MPLFFTTYCAQKTELRSLENWSYKYGVDSNRDARWQSTRTLLNPRDRRGRKVLVLRARLPEGTAGRTLFIPYAFTSLEVSRAEPKPRRGRPFTGKTWRMLDLKEADAGEFVYLHVHSDYHFIGVTGDVLLGRKSDLILRMVRGDLDRFGLAVLYLFLGLTAIYLYLRRRTRREFLAFAIFVLSVGFYTIFYTRGLQLFIYQPRLLAAFWLISLFLVPTAIAWFMELLFGPGPGRALFWMRIVMLTYGVGSLSLAAMGLVHPLKIRVPFFVLMLASLGVALWILASAIRRGDINARIFLLGLSILAGIAALDINLALFTDESAERPRPMSHLGMFAFVASLIYILGRRFAQTYRDLERYSRELEQARDAMAGHAEQLARNVREATEQLRGANDELKTRNQSLRESNTSLEEARRTARTDLEMAMHVQSRVLPAEPPAVRGWEIAFHYEAAMGISGDFYDFFTREDELLGTGIFDVSGHGTASGLITILTRSIVHRQFRALASEPLGRVMTAVNEELITELERVDNFVTGALVRPTPGGVDCVLAGHTRPLIKRVDGSMETIGGGSDDPRGSILGSYYARGDYRAMSRQIHPGDTLLLYTDALIEGTDHRQEPFQMSGLREALARVPKEAGPRETLDELLDALRDHTGAAPLEDDLTVIVLKKT